MTNSNKGWLDRLVRAQAEVRQRQAQYQATLGNPDALIASPEWRRFERAMERRDKVLAGHFDELLQLAQEGARHA